MPTWIQAATPYVLLAANALLGLLVWGFKAQIRADLAEMDMRLFQRINGTYVRKETYADLKERVDRIESRVGEID